jgi:hypothetical protein
MDKIQIHNIIDNDGNSVPDVTIESKCAITEIVNNSKDKKTLVKDLKHYINTDFFISTHNFEISIYDNEGNNLHFFTLQIDKSEVINKLDIIIPNKTLNQ